MGRPALFTVAVQVWAGMWSERIAKHAASMRERRRKAKQGRVLCGCGACGRCSHRDYMRRYRARTLYDHIVGNPADERSPYMASAWPMLIEIADLFGE